MPLRCAIFTESEHNDFDCSQRAESGPRSNYPGLMGIQRGTGRAALVEATAEALMRGDEVRVIDVAAAAGVSHTLVYRHFPSGGRDEMIAEAYALLYRGMSIGDFEAFAQLMTDPAVSRSLAHASISGDESSRAAHIEALRHRLEEFVASLLHPRRTAIRIARLKALVEAQTNAYVAERIEDVRRSLVQDLAAMIQRAVPDLDPLDATSLSIISQALPLGVTTITGGSMTARQRDHVAAMWTRMAMAILVRPRE